MANKTNDKKLIRELQARLREALDTIDRLSLDPAYGILTRQALELELEGRKKEVRFVAFLDVDYLHDFNIRFGHEEANNRIRRALNLRSSDIVLTGRWYSGDEIAILLNGDPEGFIDRLKKAFIEEGLSITISFVPFSGSIERDIERAKKEVFRMKAERGSQR